MKPKPNIFDYATSELSQDAFLCWLIQWANKDYQNIDSYLNNCAISFVQSLLEKDHSFKIEKVEVRKQWKNIDVCALVNEKYFLVIEDKKGTKEHSNQLIRYSEIAKKHYEKSDIEVKLIYFKMEEQGDYSNVKKAGYLIFQRSKMLSILKNYILKTGKSKQNDIIVDYYENLKNLDININSFLTNPLNEWNAYSWKGFYFALQKYIRGKWGYISNPSGGFEGFSWNWNSSIIEGVKVEYYLQLEQDRLVFKLYVPDKNKRKKLRTLFRRFLNKNANEMNINISNFGRLGKFMGIAKLSTDYRITQENGLFNFHETVYNLKKITNLLNSIESEIEAYNKGI